MSPDGALLAYVRGGGDLIVRDLASGKEQVRVKSWNTHGHRFSPDGKWIAYNISDNEYNSDIWLVPARGGKPVNVTSHPDSDYGLRWAESGRALVFVSGRGKDRDVWHVWLRAEDALLSTVERAEQLKKIKSALAERRKRRASARSKQAGAPKKQAGPVGQKPPAASAGKPAAPTGPAKPKKSAKPVAKGKQQPDLLAVRVDGEELFLRVQRVSRLPGDESNVCVDPAGTQVLFTGQLAGNTAIFRAKYDGSGLRTLVPSVSGVSRMRYGPMGRKVYYLGTGGVIGTLDPASGRTGKIDFEARLLTDRQHVRSQKFEECWRLIRDWFYDAKYHGADWHKLRRRYRSLALTTRHLSDFNFVIKLMLGELNASHVGISGPRSASSANEQSGELGIDLDPGHIGPGLRVAQVLAHGPSMRRQARLEPGDILLGVDGHPIGPRTNLWQLLIDTAGQPVRLSVKRGTQTQMIEVRPVSAGADRSLRYREWVSSRRALVDKLSGGKLGYIHIQGMNWSSLERFERDLYARAHGKQGLLVDVRYNGGGWTTDQLLVMLQTKAHAFTVGRGGGKGYPQGRRPFYAWQKPVGLLCNEMSFSNAEIFSHAFRTLELGPIVGQPTYGGVISTGAATLIDGARFRMPGRGWYVWPKGQDMEFYGARPHHLVVQTPDSENAGADPQLERAVKVLLEKK